MYVKDDGIVEELVTEYRRAFWLGYS